MWYPAGDEFLLFGGCYPCSAAVWAFHVATSSWSSVVTGGTSPGPRMNAVWTFDPVQGVVVLFGGTNGTGALNDTFLFAPSSGQWTPAYSPTSPPARARSAADFLSVPGNETLLMTGGTTGNSTLSDAWRFSPVSNLTIRVANLTSRLPIPNALVRLVNSSHGLTNASGSLELTFVPATEITLNTSAPGYAILVRSLWVPPAVDLTIWLNLTPVPPGSVIVRVTTTTSQPIEGADANISIEGALVADPPLLTNAAGYANYTGVSPFTANVSGWYPGYHTQNTTVSIASGRAINVTLELVPQVRVHAYVLGDLADGNVTPLQTVLIRINGTIAGMTDDGGRLNATSDALGPVQVTASVYGFEAGNLSVTLPFTGSVDANFTLTAEPFPLLTVQVDDRVNGRGILGRVRQRDERDPDLDGPHASGRADEQHRRRGHDPAAGQLLHHGLGDRLRPELLRAGRPGAALPPDPSDDRPDAAPARDPGRPHPRLRDASTDPRGERLDQPDVQPDRQPLGLDELHPDPGRGLHPHREGGRLLHEQHRGRASGTVRSSPSS